MTTKIDAYFAHLSLHDASKYLRISAHWIQAVAPDLACQMRREARKISLLLKDAERLRAVLPNEPCLYDMLPPHQDDAKQGDAP